MTDVMLIWAAVTGMAANWFVVALVIAITGRKMEITWSDAVLRGVLFGLASTVIGIAIWSISRV